MLTPNEIVQGRIFWLTKSSESSGPEDSDDEPRIRRNSSETVDGVEIGVRGHPVMVLHTLDGTTDVAVCLVSKFLYCPPLHCR